MLVLGVCEVSARQEYPTWPTKTFSACVRSCWAQYGRKTCGAECKNSGLRPELTAACEKQCFESSTACVKNCFPPESDVS